MRHVTDAERAALEAGLRSHEAFTVRRCPILLASAARQKPASIAMTLRCAPQTVRNVLHAFDARGLACVQRGSNVPIKVAPVLNAEKREQVRAILHQSPRTVGQPASVWTLKRLAEVCHAQGLSDTTLSCPTMLDAIVRLGVSWPRGKHWTVSPDPAYERKKRRDHLIQMAAWSDDKPARLVEKTVPAKDPEGKAVACYGLSVPTANQMLLRFVRGRPVSVVTCAFLAWLAVYFTAQGTRALVLIWDNAAWHVSQAVQAWIKTHNRQAKPEGGCRLISCRFPSKSPWLNPIEPKWVHGKRAVVEPARVLSMAELMQRGCAYYTPRAFY